jgi:hypothetical protein
MIKSLQKLHYPFTRYEMRPLYFDYFKFVLYMVCCHQNTFQIVDTINRKPPPIN